MPEIMNWEICGREFIKKAEPDKNQIQSILERTKQRLDFIKTLKPTKENSQFLVENYYEAIKELLIAFMLKDSMRSKNHQCLISYFYKKHPEYEHYAYIISQMSYFRNRLEYYGESIPYEFHETNQKEFEKIIKIIMELI